MSNSSLSVEVAWLIGHPRNGSGSQDLAGVEQPGGIERLLDRPHHRQRLAMLGGEEIDLAVADAMLAGTGAAERQRPHHHAVVELPGALELLLVRRIDDEDEMEVAIADMADQRRQQARLG